MSETSYGSVFEDFYCANESFDKYTGVMYYKVEVPSRYAVMMQAFNVADDMSELNAFIECYNRDNNTCFSIDDCLSVYNRIDNLLRKRFGKYQLLFCMTDVTSNIVVKEFIPFGNNILVKLMIRG